MWFKKADPFEPCMPEVDREVNLVDLFAHTRSRLAFERPTPTAQPGQRCIAIVTPAREVAVVDGLLPGTAPDRFVETARFFLPFNRPLNITAIGYCGSKPLKRDDLKRLPFVAAMLSFTYVGHSVVVFEGHSSGFEAALRGADVLMVDSYMLPHLQHDWFAVSRQVLGRNGRVRVFERKTIKILPVVPTSVPPGWEYATEDDGETSYVNALLTTLGKRPLLTIDLDSSQPLPDLTTLATDPEEIDWTAKLPFQYDILDVHEVIRVIENTPNMNWSPAGDHTAKTATANMLLVASGGSQRTVTFRFLLAAGDGGVQSLRIERVA
jgi:hypothetical protein